MPKNERLLNEYEINAAIALNEVGSDFVAVANAQLSKTNAEWREKLRLLLVAVESAEDEAQHDQGCSTATDGSCDCPLSDWLSVANDLRHLGTEG